MRGILLPLTIRQGADERIAFRLYDELPETIIAEDGTSTTGPGVLTDLTGLTFRSQFRAPNEAGAVQLDLGPNRFTVEQLSNDQGIPETWVVLHIPYALTGAMTAAKGVYDIEAVDTTNDEVIEVMYGPYTLALETTRST